MDSNDWFDLRDTASDGVLGNWLAFDDPQPYSASPPIQFLKIGDEERETHIRGRFLGQAGDYLFWVEDTKEGWSFGTLFGLF